jgi:nitroimidazol reductase NimA-like FMN-containing flavoprotein (pyridoxamine 5'-phosphate oxidase superfamily)
MPITWPDEADEIITGDLTAALAYVTPAGGAVVTAVAPIGLRDRDAGTVSFTTSLGLGRKLERIARNPRVALAYHAREHGFTARPGYVLVQGDAKPAREPDRHYIEGTLKPQATRFMGPPKEGKLFWNRWLREYYQDRIPVALPVARMTFWPDARCAGPPDVHGAPAAGDPPSQDEPAKGAGPRLDSERAAARLRALDHCLLAYVGGDGYPDVVPVEVASAGPEGIRLAAERRLAPGSRRAGLLAHSYRPKLIGLAARQHTGWLTVDEQGALYAPHTDTGFRAPANKTLLLLGNGFLAKRGLRRARRAGAGAAPGAAERA